MGDEKRGTRAGRGKKDGGRRERGRGVGRRERGGRGGREKGEGREGGGGEERLHAAPRARRLARAAPPHAITRDHARARKFLRVQVQAACVHAPAGIAAFSSHTRTPSIARTHAHTRLRARARPHAHTGAQAHAHVRARSPVSTCVPGHTRGSSQRRACARAHAQTQARKHAHARPRLDGGDVDLGVANEDALPPQRHCERRE